MSDLMQRLRHGATFDSKGAFTLDRRKALDKMREFQLVDPHEYVLFLVQAAVAGKAASIAFSSGTAAAAEGASASVWMPGLVFEKEFLDDPLSGLFISQERRDAESWRCLSIALNALLSLERGTIEVESGAWGCMLGRENVEVTAAKSFIPGTRVRLHEGWLTMAARVLGSSPEIHALQAKAWPCPIPILLNGAPMGGDGWRAAAERRVSEEGPWLESVSLEKDGLRASLFALPGAVGGRLTLVKNGTVLTDRPLVMPLSPRVVAFGDHLLSNASGSDVVEDAAYESLLAFLSASCDALVEKLSSRLEADDEGRAASRTLLLPEVARRFGLKKRRGKAMIEPLQAGSAADALLAAPLFTLLDRGVASLQQLQVELEARGRIVWYGGGTTLSAAAELLLLQPSGRAEAEALEALLGDAWVELTADDPAMRRMVNLERWRRARAIPELPARGTDLETRTFNEAGFNGELRLDAEGDARLSIFVDGRFLVDRVEKLHGMSFRAAINARAFKPDYAFESVVIDDAWKAGLAFLAEQYEAACVQWCGRLPATSPLAGDAAPHVRAVLEWYRASMRDPAALPPVLSAYPALPTASGRRASVGDLQRDAAEFHKVHYARTREQGGQRDHRQIVLDMDGRLSSLLKYWFRRVDVVDYTRELAAERAALSTIAAGDLTLGGQALYAIPLEDVGVKGAIGISLGAAAPAAAPQRAKKKTREKARTKQAVASGPSASRVQVLRDGHPLEIREVRLPVGALEAIVDAPALSSRQGGGVLEDEAWEAVLAALRRAVPKLVAHAASRLAERTDADWKQRAAERLVLEYLQGTPPQDIPADLARVRLFSVLGPARVSLAELRAAHADGTPLRFVVESGVPPPTTGLALGERPVLHLRGREDAGYEAALRHCLGSHNLLDWTPDWQSLRARAAFLAQPSRALVLDLEDPVAVVRVQRDGLEGTVGLAPVLPGRRCDTRVVLLREGRLLDTMTVRTLLPMEAVFSSDGFAPDRAWRALASSDGPAVGTMLEALQAAMTEALSIAGAKAHPHSVAAHQVLTWIGAARAGRLEAAAQDTELLPRLEELGLLEALDGTRVSPARAAAELQAKRRLLFVRPAIRGKAEGDTLVLRLDEEEERLVRALYSPLVSYERELALDESARENREKRRLRVRDVGAEPLLAREPVEAEGMRGELAVARSLRSSVVLARDGVVLQQGPLCGAVPIVGIVEGSALEPTRTWDGVKLKDVQVDVLREALKRLMGKVAALVATSDAAREALLAYIGWCRQEGRGVDDVISGASAFERVGGGRASLSEIVAASSSGVVLYARHDGQPSEGQLVVMADSVTAAFLTSYFGERAVREIDPPPVATFARDLVARVSELKSSTVAGFKKMADSITEVVTHHLQERERSRETVVDEARERAEAQREDERKARKRELRETSRQEREAAALDDPLEAALRGCFQALPWVTGCRWPATLLRSIRLGRVPGGMLLELSGRGAIVLGERHPLVRQARALPLDDREVVACLASAVFTELNRLRADVRDEDEVRFMLDLADWVMSSK